MPLDRIPILSKDYPLFDWKNHLESYYALGEGELVAGFHKETWNSIIDETLAALSAAGHIWDTKYTTSEGAKVKEAYGDLSAKKFNSVRYNIDLLAPIGWGWANNPNIRGYIGREDFFGYSEKGLGGDLFYAEYLLELARRLNVLLSIMKGTANLDEMISSTPSKSESIHNLMSLSSVPIYYGKCSGTDYVCGIIAKKAGQFAFLGGSQTQALSQGKRLPPTIINAETLAKTAQSSKLHSPYVVMLPRFSATYRSLVKAAMDVFNALYLGFGNGKSMSVASGSINSLASRPIFTGSSSKSFVIVSPTIREPRALHIGAKSTAIESGDITASKAKNVYSSRLSKSNARVPLEWVRPKRFVANALSNAKCKAKLDSAWLAPIWINGKLYIRQVYTTAQTNNTLEVT